MWAFLFDVFGMNLQLTRNPQLKPWVLKPWVY